MCAPGGRDPSERRSQPSKRVQDVRPWMASSSTTESANRNTTSCQDSRTLLRSRPRGKRRISCQLLPSLVPPRLPSWRCAGLSSGKGTSVFGWFLSLLQLALHSAAWKDWFAASGKSIYWFGCGQLQQPGQPPLPHLQVSRHPPAVAPSAPPFRRGGPEDHLYACGVPSLLRSLVSECSFLWNEPKKKSLSEVHFPAVLMVMLDRLRRVRMKFSCKIFHWACVKMGLVY